MQDALRDDQHQDEQVTRDDGRVNANESRTGGKISRHTALLQRTLKEGENGFYTAYRQEIEMNYKNRTTFSIRKRLTKKNRIGEMKCHSLNISENSK